ncbi:MAG: hypothetical protein HY925_16230 [Elusimicrobia bacterium]|nr:hypothetical protein [Elusimicrobiota bacterium]
MNLAWAAFLVLPAPARAQVHVEPVSVSVPIHTGPAAASLAGAQALSGPTLSLGAQLVSSPLTRASVLPRAAAGSGRLRASPVASRDWDAFFDQSRVQSRLELAGLAAAYPDGSWKESLPRLFEPYVQLGGKVTPELLAGASHRAEDWTYIFRDHPLWKKPLEEYLDGLIARRKDSRRLDLDSVGAGYGSEAYSLAIVVDEALRRAGEEPAAWDVRIRAQDLSIASLLAADRGLYRPGERDKETFAELGLEKYFEPAEGGLLRLKRPMRDWIRPYFVDLNDPRQHSLLPALTDVLFGNYLLFHLRRDPATALAEKWLAGEWSDHGFLSMAQVVVAEVGRSARAKVDVPLNYLFSSNVGWAGLAFYGDNYRVPGGFKDAMRELFRRRGLVKKVQERGGSVDRELSRDAFHRFALDPKAVASMRRAAARAGLSPSLTTDDISVRADADSGKLYVNVGWLLEAPDGEERIAAFEKLVSKELERVPPTGRSPPAGPISGRLYGGGVLKVDETGSAPMLYWLTDRLVPISAAYRSDNAAKSEKKLEGDQQRNSRFDSNGMPKGVRGFY